MSFLKTLEIPSANFKLTRHCLFRFADHAKGNGECFKNDIPSQGHGLVVKIMVGSLWGE